MKNKKGNVGMLAVIVIIVILTIGIFTWFFVKKTQVPVAEMPVQTQNSIKQQSTQVSQKTPEKVVEEFYGWYLRISQVALEKALATGKPVFMDEDVKNSPYVYNLIEKKGMYDAIICSQDSPDGETIVHSQAEINGDKAVIEIKKVANFTSKIRVSLVNINQEWKINKIDCLSL